MARRRSPDLTLRIVGRLADLPAASWNALLVAGECPFLEHAWLSALEETGCAVEERGWLAQHVTLWQGPELVAAAPAYLKAHSEGEFVFDWGWAEAAMRLGLSYYPKLLCAIPFTPVGARKLLVKPGEDLDLMTAALWEGLRGVAEATGCSSVHILFPQPDEADRLEGLGLARRSGIQYHWHNAGYRAYEDFLQRFSSKRRNALRRERAQLARDGVTLRTLRGEALTSEVMRSLHGLYLGTVDKYVWGRRYLTPELFQRIGQTFAHRLEAVVAEKEGRMIGAALNAASETTLYGRYWGAADDERNWPFLHFNVCFYHSIDECIARGLTLFEPGAGGEHKFVRGFEPVVTHSLHHIFDPRLDGPIRNFLAREGPAVEAHRLGLLQESPLKPR